jgi:hypothetical protein
MPELLEIIEEMRGRPGEWDYQDTLAWANLHLRSNTVAETENVMQGLINRNDIDRQWKVETKERYEFYNQLHTDHVTLNVPPP